MDQQQKILQIFQKLRSKIAAIRKELVSEKTSRIASETAKQISDLQSKIKNL
jgi:hypothetical protein